MSDTGSGSKTAGVGRGKRYRVTVEDVAQFLARHGRVSQERLARELGTSRKAIARRLAKIPGYESRADRRTRYFADLKAFIAENPELTVAEIAAARGENPDAVRDYVLRHGKALGYVRKKPCAKRVYSRKVTKQEVEAAVAEHGWANNRELAVILSKPVEIRALATATSTGAEVAAVLTEKQWAEGVDEDSIRLSTYLRRIESDLVELFGQEAESVVAVLKSSQISSKTLSEYTKKMPAYSPKRGILPDGPKRPRGGPQPRATVEEVYAYWKRTGASQAEMGLHFGLHQSSISKKLAGVPGYEPGGYGHRRPTGADRDFGPGLPVERRFSLRRELRSHPGTDQEKSALLARLRAGREEARCEVLHLYGRLACEVVEQLLAPWDDLHDDLLNEAALHLITLAEDYSRDRSPGDDTGLEDHLRTALLEQLKKELRRQSFRWGRKSLSSPRFPDRRAGFDVADLHSLREQDLVDRLDRGGSRR